MGVSRPINFKWRPDSRLLFVSLSLSLFPLRSSPAGGVDGARRGEDFLPACHVKVNKVKICWILVRLDFLFNLYWEFILEIFHTGNPFKLLYIWLWFIMKIFDDLLVSVVFVIQSMSYYVFFILYFSYVFQVVKKLMFTWFSIISQSSDTIIN